MIFFGVQIKNSAIGRECSKPVWWNCGKSQNYCLNTLFWQFVCLEEAQGIWGWAELNPWFQGVVAVIYGCYMGSSQWILLPIDQVVVGDMY